MYLEQRDKNVSNLHKSILLILQNINTTLYTNESLPIQAYNIFKSQTLPTLYS